MMTNGTILFDPLIPWAIWVALAALALCGVIFAQYRRLAGWVFRGAVAAALLLVLSGPSLQQENRAALSDIVVMVVDQTASQKLSDRAQQTERAAQIMARRIAARPNTELHRVDVSDAADEGGTALMAALADALSQIPRGRVAGMVLISDGQVHDMDHLPALPAPLHLLRTGKEQDWDRRLIIKNAPGFAILGEEIILTLQIEDQGTAPGATHTPLDVSVDGALPQRVRVPIGREISLPVSLSHAGRNVIRFSVPYEQGELTDRNNAALVQINGVRDRLRVLLVSGAPHPGGRTWRNLLKSDSSVDLVHFTILRPPEKQDGVPVDELSLIAFPTRELFLEKVDDFDLIIFDRYKRRGILPGIYLENVVRYVREGGAVLIAAGPDFASAESLYRSPLSEILPARPTARVIEQGYRPVVSDLGQRHPVTADLVPADAPPWGRWMRQIDTVAERGDVLMNGFENRPLLVLDRVGEGRVAMLASDQAWLWDRGFEGGGPQLELLRRLAHWMMKEPELEEEALFADAVGQQMRIARRSLSQDVGAVEIETPNGDTIQIELKETAPGQFEAVFDGPEIGLYRLKEGEQSTVIGLGPAAPREFVSTVASSQILAPAIDSTRGGNMAVADGLPQLRDVRAGRAAAGRNWVGLTPRNAFETLDIRHRPLMPGWLALLIIAGLTVAAWLREGRR